MGNLSSRPVEQSAAVNVPLQSGKRKQPASPLAHPRDAAVRPASSAAARRSLPSNQSSRPSKYARSKWKRSASLGRAVDPTSHPDATLKIIGYFGGAGVVVKRSEWITELVYCGGYGKGIFSRSIPSFVSQQEQQQRQHRSSPSSSRSANSASVPEMPFHYKNEALYSLPSPQLLNGRSALCLLSLFCLVCLWWLWCLRCLRCLLCLLCLWAFGTFVSGCLFLSPTNE
mmetsp:Transcript_15848/g.47585  ORF Transcript_15848/g.47585 Transcript_15848/m.47585 type:complete len:228 (-) Transcript_15848:41-724(-)